jgi:hypothetical protein
VSDALPAEQVAEPLSDTIYETLMRPGVWDAHLRGGHSIDASKHAASLADTLAAALSARLAALPAKPDVAVRLRAIEAAARAWDEADDALTTFDENAIAEFNETGARADADEGERRWKAKAAAETALRAALTEQEAGRE